VGQDGTYKPQTAGPKPAWASSNVNASRFLPGGWFLGKVCMEASLTCSPCRADSTQNFPLLFFVFINIRVNIFSGAAAFRGVTGCIDK
jgi:hypothetical protein